jgi:hypothetical protein
MRRIKYVLAALATGLAASCAAKGPEPMAPAMSSMESTSPGSVKRANVVTMSAIVDDIDVAKRQVTLRTADGKKTTLRVGPEVKNLPQVKKGDEVTVGYLEALAIQVKKPGEGELGTVGAEEIGTAAPGEKPAGVAAQAVKITAKIVAIDREGQQVTLEGKEGDQVTIDVRNPEHFDAIAVGDLVEITYTESMAISVESTK